MLNKTVARVTLVYTLSGSVYAESEFGALTLHSLMNESLDATIILRHDAESKGHPIKLSLGSLVDFYRHKIEPSSLSSSLKFTIVEQDEKEAKVRVTSDLPINAGDFGFVVRSYVDKDKTYGAYKYIKPALNDEEEQEPTVCNTITWSGEGGCLFLMDQALAKVKVLPKTKGNAKLSEKDEMMLPEEYDLGFLDEETETKSNSHVTGTSEISTTNAKDDKKALSSNKGVEFVDRSKLENQKMSQKVAVENTENDVDAEDELAAALQKNWAQLKPKMK